MSNNFNLKYGDWRSQFFSCPVWRSLFRKGVVMERDC